MEIIEKMNNNLINDYKALELLELEHNKTFELQLKKEATLEELNNKRKSHQDYVQYLQEKYKIEFTPFYKDDSAKYYESSGLYSYCDRFKRELLKEGVK